MSCKSIVTNYYNKYSKKITISTITETYIQSTIVKNTLESISFENRKSMEDKGTKVQLESLTIRNVVASN